MFTAGWVLESKHRGMQEGASETEWGTTSPISIIAENRMVDRLEMDTDLMGPACFKPAVETTQYGVVEPLDHSVVRSGRAAIGHNRVASGVARGPTKGSINNTFVRGKVAPHDGLVSTDHRSRCQLSDKMVKTCGRPGHHEKARGSLVEPMHNARPEWVIANCLEIGKLVEQPLNHCARLHPGPRVHHHPCRLVDDDDLIVDVDHRHHY